MKRILIVLAVIAVLLASCTQAFDPLEGATLASMAEAKALGAVQGGADQFGYNAKARLFNGPADGVDRNLDGTVWGDPAYASDHLVMKWSKAWVEGKATGVWTPEAWTTNAWNGKVPGGSGEVWHYKMIWVGPELQASPYWHQGGYPIWGQFEVIMDHGTIMNEHFWYAHAKPGGF